jgi:hypothetical protein
VKAATSGGQSVTSFGMRDVHFHNRVSEALGEAVGKIESLAQDRASAESVLYTKESSDEEKATARLEYELRYEVEFLKLGAKILAERIEEREGLLKKAFGRRDAQYIDEVRDV